MLSVSYVKSSGPTGPGTSVLARPSRNLSTRPSLETLRLAGCPQKTDLPKKHLTAPRSCVPIEPAFPLFYVFRTPVGRTLISGHAFTRFPPWMCSGYRFRTGMFRTVLSSRDGHAGLVSTHRFGHSSRPYCRGFLRATTYELRDRYDSCADALTTKLVAHGRFSDFEAT